jgi:hypothetical protein
MKINDSIIDKQSVSFILDKSTDLEKLGLTFPIGEFSIGIAGTIGVGIGSIGNSIGDPISSKIGSSTYVELINSGNFSERSSSISNLDSIGISGKVDDLLIKFGISITSFLLKS